MRHAAAPEVVDITTLIEQMVGRAIPGLLVQDLALGFDPRMLELAAPRRARLDPLHVWPDSMTGSRSKTSAAVL